MAESTQIETMLEKAAADLFNYAIDREDIKWLVGRLPEEASVKPSTVDYELQLLKIVSIGWSISYYLDGQLQKGELSGRYWASIQKFSRELSDSAGLMTGQDIDYFQTLKTRLDLYVAALERTTNSGDPAIPIGHEFAGQCGNREDLFAFMAGSKMFMTAINSAREYLSRMKFE